MKLHEDIVEAIKKNKLYDHMVDHGWKYSKYDLIKIIEKLAFAVFIALNKDDKAKVYERMLSENERADE